MKRVVPNFFALLFVAAANFLGVFDAYGTGTALAQNATAPAPAARQVTQNPVQNTIIEVTSEQGFLAEVMKPGAFYLLVITDNCERCEKAKASLVGAAGNFAGKIRLAVVNNTQHQVAPPEVNPETPFVLLFDTQRGVVLPLKAKTDADSLKLALTALHDTLSDVLDDPNDSQIKPPDEKKLDEKKPDEKNLDWKKLDEKNVDKKRPADNNRNVPVENDVEQVSLVSMNERAARRRTDQKRADQKRKDQKPVVKPGSRMGKPDNLSQYRSVAA